MGLIYTDLLSVYVIDTEDREVNITIKSLQSGAATMKTQWRFLKNKKQKHTIQKFHSWVYI